MAALAGTVLFLAGGCVSFQPVPGPGRDGEFYIYTKRYDEEELPFSLPGRAFCAETTRLPCLIYPALVVGVPLYCVERWVVCPVVDTAMLPWDLVLRLRNAHASWCNGLRVRILDPDGRPAAGFRVGFSMAAREGHRIIHGSRSVPDDTLVLELCTDGNGEVFLPVDLDSCARVIIYGSGTASTRSFGAMVQDGLCHVNGDDPRPLDETGGRKLVVFRQQWRRPPRNAPAP